MQSVKELFSSLFLFLWPCRECAVLHYRCHCFDNHMDGLTEAYEKNDKETTE